jgi:PAS domain S-box-containing protein
MGTPHRMSDRFWELLLPARGHLSERDLRACELLAATLVVLLGAAFLYIILPLGLDVRRQLIGAGLAGSSIVGLLILRRGRLGAAAGAAVMGDWAVLTFACVTGGGIYSPAYNGYVFINLIFGLIFGVRGALFAFGLTFLTGIALLLLQQEGLVSPITSGPPHNILIVNSFLQVIGTALVIVVTRMIGLFSSHAEAELSARIRIQDEMNKSVGKFRSLVQNSYDVTTIHDADGTITYASPSTKRVLGYAPEQLVGRSPIEFIDPRDAPLVLADLRDVAIGQNDGRPTLYRFRRADGTNVWLESIGNNHLDDPEIQGLIINTRDITQRQSVEEALRQSEQLFRLVFEHSPVGIVLISPEGRILRANQRIGQLFGYAEAELQSTTIYDLTYPEDRAKSHSFAEDLAQSADRPLRIQKRYIAKDGSIVWGEGVSTSVKDDQGGLLYYIAHIQDVGERRKAEIALRESEERFRSLSESAFEGIVIGEQGRVVDANTQMALLLGLELHKLIGRKVSDFVPTESLPTVMFMIETGSEAPYEHLIRREDGEVRMVEARGKPMPYRGRSMRVTAIRDITERKKSEERLRASLKEKEVLLKEIHHRVKNNLQVINSLLNLQGATLNDPAMKALFGESQNRIRSMALIHEVLYRSQDLAAVPFGEYSRLLLRQLISTYAVSDVRTEVRVQDFALGVDQAIPCGLLLNELVSNALKHAFPRGGAGCVSLEIGEHEGLCTIRVSDDGVGLPEGFDAYHSKTLGMQLLTTLTRQLEGQLTITSDAGATFCVTFPTS